MAASAKAISWYREQAGKVRIDTGRLLHHRRDVPRLRWGPTPPKGQRFFSHVDERAMTPTALDSLSVASAEIDKAASPRDHMPPR
jgi:hypothetical protein